LKAITNIGIGTVQFGVKYGIANQTGQTSEANAFEVLDIAMTLGINTIDTASSYGTSEVVLGKYKHISQFNIISKFIDANDRYDLYNQFKKTKLNLNVKNVYGYLSHRPMQLIQYPILWDVLLQMKKAGEIEKIGYSLNTVEELKILLDKDLIPDLVQIPFNYLDQRFKPYFGMLKKLKCEIHTRSTFLQGLLLMPIETIPKYFEPIKSLLIDIDNQTNNKNGAFLRYVLEEPAIDRVILGVENKTQFLQNIESLNNAIKLKGHDKNLADEILIPSLWP
jgi:aryl-alcohol dehydrogenase-like predicted oxidoreductase